MPDSLRLAELFLVNTIFDLYLFVLAVRLLLVYAGANYFDQITQMVVKITDFIVKPVRRVIPNVGRVELSTIVIMLLIQCIKFFLVAMITFGLPNFLGIIILAFTDSLKIILLTLFYAILIQVILTWIQPHSPVLRTFMQMTSPLMKPLHRLIPPIGGIDITPIPALILLQLMMILIVNPLTQFGVGVSLG